jgi:5-oxoprolinase (ATP-hydrolysing)
MATSPARITRVQGLVCALAKETLPRVGAAVRAAGRLALASLRRELGRGPASIEASVACRYRGQSFEIEVPFGRDLAGALARAHRARHGFDLADLEIECVAVKASAVRRPPRIAKAPVQAAPRGGAQRRFALLRWIEGHRSAARRVPVLERDSLARGSRGAGPAVVLEPTATTIVEPGFSWRIDRTSCLRMRRTT